MFKVPSVRGYPKKWHLRGSTYRMVFVRGLKDLGNTDSEKRLIQIRAGMSKNETFKTVIHELLHMAEFEFPVRLKHKTIYRLEEAIFNFLIDNFS